MPLETEIHKLIISSAFTRSSLHLREVLILVEIIRQSVQIY